MVLSVATQTQPFCYGTETLTAGIALQIADGTRKGILSLEARTRVSQSEGWVQEISEGEAAVYGVNTGFGPLCTTRVSPAHLATLQHNILKSHSVGVGDLIPEAVSRLMLVLKLQALAQGHSGVRLATLDRILWQLDAGVIPCVPSQGSVGASGDLAPLSHLFLPLIGEGEVWDNGQRRPTGEVLQRHGVAPLQLAPKEGLALINGTQFMAAHAVHIVERLHNCLSQADIIAAMMIEGLKGSASPFMAELHRLRPHAGSQHVAHRMAHLFADSDIMASHHDCGRVQDPYSLRCIPQVHGASRQAWLHLKDTLEVELNAVTDNPILIHKGLTVSGGHFHGQPIALPMDYACLAAAELGNISDRRVYLSLEGRAPGVPKLLMEETGHNSGFMILQYTTAALVSENKGQCFPASADSIPTSLGQEDHVSMGSISGRKALRVIENLERIMAIELMCAGQALDFHLPLKPSPILQGCHQMLRAYVAHAKEDRYFAPDIAEAHRLVREGALLSIANEIADAKHLSFYSDQHERFELY